MSDMGRSKIPGIFLILLAGVLLNFGLVKIVRTKSDKWAVRISSGLAIAAAYAYAMDKYPKRIL